MTLILQGTDNSVSTPAVQGGTAGATTGVYYPATNVVAMATAGSEGLRLNASGQLVLSYGAGAFQPLLYRDSTYACLSVDTTANSSGLGLLAIRNNGTLYGLIDSSGNYNFKTNNAGIIFQNSSALTNSTLNDYEAGTWSPSVGGTSSCAGYGTYVKIGKLVCVNFDIQINTIGTGSTAKITNFPFACGNNGGPSTGSVSYYSGLSISPIFIAFYVENNAITAPFVWNTAGSSTVGFNATALFQSASRVIGTVTYSASF